MPASASKKASNTPAWLKRQKRFQIEFQFPNVSGRARQVMLWTEKKWSASRKVRSFRPLPPRRERQARNTSRTVSQSSSVIRVSMVGLLKPTHQEAQIRSAGNQQARLLASIRPHGVNRVQFESSNSCGLGWAVRVPIWSLFIGGDQIS
jgi:hypothetical protein